MSARDEIVGEGVEHVVDMDADFGKHGVKQVDRLLSNDRIDVKERCGFLSVLESSCGGLAEIERQVLDVGRPIAGIPIEAALCQRTLRERLRSLSLRRAV